jgi:hypothetical protein
LPDLLTRDADVGQQPVIEFEQHPALGLALRRKPNCAHSVGSELRQRSRDASISPAGADSTVRMMDRMCHVQILCGSTRFRRRIEYGRAHLPAKHGFSTLPQIFS